MPDVAGATGNATEKDDAVSRAIESFWRGGLVGTTTRTLQRDLGLSAEALGATFGTKKALRNNAIDAYLQRVDAQLVTPLDRPDADLEDLCRFFDGVTSWVTDPKHPGCMLVNLLGESGADDEFLLSRSTMLRERLQGALTAVLDRVDPATAHARTSVLIATFFGVCLIARTGADDVADVVTSAQAQIRAWRI